MNKNFLGITWKLIACASFAGMNIIIKYLTSPTNGITDTLSVNIVLLFQTIFSICLVLPLTLKIKRPAFSTAKFKIHLIRIFSAVLGIFLFYIALSKLPIPQVVSLQFTGPIFTIIGAKIFLLEKIGKLRLLGIILGILGALLIVRPDKQLLSYNILSSWFIFFPLIGSVLFVCAKISVRKLTNMGENPILLTLYLDLAIFPFALLLSYGEWQTLNIVHISYLILLGFLSSLAHISTAKAYVYSEVSLLAPVGSARLIFSIFLSFIIFNEYPQEQFAIYGMLLILAAVLLITFIERKNKIRKE